MIKKKEIQVLSNWVNLVTKTIIDENNQPQIYHSFQQFDYVSVLPVTKKGMIPMVEQFRPALERRTLELPGCLFR